MKSNVSFSPGETKSHAAMRSDFSTFAKIVPMLFAVTFLALSCNNSREYVPKAEIKVPSKVQNFTNGEVKLLDGPFKESQDAEAKYLLSLNKDRLLSPFITESGLTPKDSAYPGWETEILPGVALSFYLSGMARMYVATENKEYLDAINYVLDELERCQKHNGGYLLGTANGKKIFERVAKEGCFDDFGRWGYGEATPFYALEKLMSGLRDVYRICHIQKALSISIGIGDWLSKLMSTISDNELQKFMHIEYGGMNWLLSDLYADTGDKRYMEMSKRWQDSITVVPMVNGIDKLNNKHANMQFPKYSGLAARYPYSGDKGDLYGARFFWENVVHHRTYVTGGNSESEYFGPKDSLATRLSPYTEENCNEYNMLRLTSLLNQIEPKAEYADYFERTLLNHILAAQNTADEKIAYYIPLLPGAQRLYQSLFNDFSCCVCSSMDSYTRHGEYIYAHSDSSLYVNLFIASEVNWKGKGISIKQETKFPFEDSSTLKIECNKETDLTLQIRNPHWLAAPMIIKVNGTVQEVSPVSGYLNIKRTWHSGDILSINLPMNIRTESMPDDKNKIALFYGPVLLAGTLDKDEAQALVEANMAPALVPGSKPIDQWLKPAGEPLCYTTTISWPNQINLKPHFMLKTGPFSVYWQQLTDEELQQRIASGEKKKQDLKKREKLTVDAVFIGNEESEQTHFLAGKSRIGRGNHGILEDQKWRAATDPAGFSYRVKVNGNSALSLACKFMGRGSYEAWHCMIKIDTTTIVKLDRGKDDSYPVVPFEYTFPIPFELTKGKDSVKVAFEVSEAEKMPRLMEMRVIKR